MRDFNTAFVNTNSVAFPNTEAVNSSSPSATDGTEFIKIMIDDGAGWGYVQALFDEAGITPNGTAEAVGASQKLDALEILFGIPLGYISGLLPVIAADTDHDISFGVGEARSDLASSLKRIALATALIKQIDVDWAPGNNSGGFPSGLTLAIDTWYHLFIIRNNTTKAVDAGFDTSLTAANLLADAAGYTEFRRIGSVLTDGSSNILEFISFETAGGGLGMMIEIAQEFMETPASTAEITKTLARIPTGITVEADLTVGLENTASAELLFDSADVTLVLPTSSAYNLRSRTDSTRAQIRRNTRVNSSAEVKYRVNAASGTVRMFVQGWIDQRVD